MIITKLVFTPKAVNLIIWINALFGKQMNLQHRYILATELILEILKLKVSETLDISSVNSVKISALERMERQVWRTNCREYLHFHCDQQMQQIRLKKNYILKWCFFQREQNTQNTLLCLSESRTVQTQL